MNPKIRRNFEVFDPCDFIAAIVQHIPDKSFQLVRYYGWYSDKMRGQRDKYVINPAGSREMRIISLVEDRDVIEKILRYLGL